MLRKLNFTSRAKIAQSSIRIALKRDSDGVLAFDPAIDVGAVTAPPDARVFIEAWHRTSYMRFDLGTVAALTIPADRRLVDIEGTSVRFRIKVVGPDHRILAVADDIRVSDRPPGEGTNSPLLPVQFNDALDQQAWRIAFEPDLPVLELNSRIANIDAIAKDDSLFFALVYPAAVREILTRILVIEQFDAFEATNDWWNLWIRWASRYTTTPVPVDADDAPRWIEEVVGSFCSQHRVVDRVNKIVEEDER